jgi:hypothetical protein
MLQTRQSPKIDPAKIVSSHIDLASTFSWPIKVQNLVAKNQETKKIGRGVSIAECGLSVVEE